MNLKEFIFNKMAENTDYKITGFKTLYYKGVQIASILKESPRGIKL